MREVQDRQDLLGRELYSLSSTLRRPSKSSKIAKATSSLKEFSKYAFVDPSVERGLSIEQTWGEGGFLPNKTFHDEIYDILDSIETEILILAPRGSAKSTVGTVVYPLYALGKNPLERIIIGSRTLNQAERFLAQIDHNMGHNEKYIEMFGNLVPPPRAGRWTTSQKTVVRDEPPGGMKDPSLFAVGVEGALPSSRASIIILDDVVDDKNQDTPAKREKVWDWFQKALLPVLVPGGRVLVLGTRWHPQDFYSSLIKLWGPRDTTLNGEEIEEMLS